MDGIQQEEALANIKFGIDTITLYSPKYWDQKDWWAFQDPDCIAPEKFWDKALDTVAMTGASGLRLSFGPAQWRHALKRYGSPGRLQDAIHPRAPRVGGAPAPGAGGRPPASGARSTGGPSTSP